MKRNLRSVLFCFAAMVAFNSNNYGQTLIHYWNFNSFNNNDTLGQNIDTVGDGINCRFILNNRIRPVSADYSIISTATAQLWYKKMAATSASWPESVSYGICFTYLDGGSGTTVNAQQSAPAGNYIRPRNPNDSMELRFYIPSTGYKSLVFSYATETSSYGSGDSIQLFSYSLDSGATWISSGSGLSEWVDSAQLTFTTKTVTINDTLANNNPRLAFRIITAGRNIGMSGNNRYDNVVLQGTAIGTVTGVAEMEKAKFTLYPNPVADNLEIISDLDGAKSIMITNTVGQTVYKGTEQGAHISTNIANLNAGIYIITIRDNNTGNANTLKFVKQ